MATASKAPPSTPRLYNAPPQGWRDELRGGWPELFARLHRIREKLLRATAFE